MNFITLFEYESLSYEFLQWTDEEIDLLGKLNDDNVPLFKLGRNSFSATQYVGVVQVNDCIIQIIPKTDYIFAEGLEHQNKYSATKNFLIMLAYVYNLPIQALNSATLEIGTSNWFELMTRFFAVELTNQFRSGVHRSYITYEDRLPYIKGKWQFSKQAARWTYDRLKFDVQYDDFSVNTPLNQIFLFVIRQLLSITNDSNNYRLLSDLLPLLDGVDQPNIPPKEMIKKIRFSRLDDRFEIAFNLAKMFIEHYSFELSVGDTRIFSFMFNMNLLFQEFVFYFIQRHQRKIFKELSSFENVINQGRNHSYKFLQKFFPVKKDFLGLKPDIVMYKENGQPLFILDTKYERLGSEDRNYKIRNQNYYQMYAYSKIIMCDDVILLFPQTHNHSVREKFLVHNQSVKINIATVNLNQPLERPEGLIREFQDIFNKAIT